MKQPQPTAKSGNVTDRLRILCVHGVGHQESDASFEPAWRSAIGDALASTGMAGGADIEFLRYDALFAAAPPDFAAWSKAFQRLLASGLGAAAQGAQARLGGLFGAPSGPGTRGLADWVGGAREDLQWTAGMVAQWVAHEDLRARARAELVSALRRFQPDLLLAHSLGSLISYDTLARVGAPAARLARELTFVSFGSQINNPFVRNCFGGRISALPTKHWFHLFNLHDNAFTAAIRTPLSNFTQVATPFDIAGALDHDATEYLRHPEAARVLWRTVAGRSATPLALEVSSVRAVAPRFEGGGLPSPRNLRDAIAFTVGSSRRTIARRALLVGINDYPRPEMRLEGCVNDVYLMSERLQELGFGAENVRMVLNERATAAAIRDRLEWLLDGCGDEQGRVFFYSGHGAQIPGYGAGETVDRADECLVPYDFDWTPERTVVDNWFYELYSQLPPAAHVLAVFDCCHSGGMSRDGGTRVRGLTPPDDIRHRILTWNPDSRTWQSRAQEASSGAALAPGRVRLRRMFRGARARAAGQPTSWANPKPFGHDGPFFPVILEACQETELAHEHRDGATAYGAFTWSLAKILEKGPRPRHWGELRRLAEARLRELGYAQTPGLEGPPATEGAAIPWLGDMPGAAGAKRSRKRA